MARERTGEPGRARADDQHIKGLRGSIRARHQWHVVPQHGRDRKRFSEIYLLLRRPAFAARLFQGRAAQLAAAKPHASPSRQSHATHSAFPQTSQLDAAATINLRGARVQLRELRSASICTGLARFCAFCLPAQRCALAFRARPPAGASQPIPRRMILPLLQGETSARRYFSCSVASTALKPSSWRDRCTPAPRAFLPARLQQFLRGRSSSRAASFSARAWA